MGEHRGSISQGRSYEDIGDFWDGQDFTEFGDPKRWDVAFVIQDTARFKSDLLAAIEKGAAGRGVSSETSVNLWPHKQVQSIMGPGVNAY